MENRNSSSGRLSAIIFTASTLLFLMLFGVGYGILVARLPEFIGRGEIGEMAAWSIRIGGGLLMVLTAVFTAHHAIAFVEIVDKHARRRPPSEPLPPLPGKRKLHLVRSESEAA